MSSWWDITFCATGELSRVDNLENELPSIFHQVVRTNREGGPFVAYVMENYGGGPVIDAMIGLYPDLTFNGVMAHESVAQDGGRYFVFSGVGGNSEWREFAFPEVDPDDVR